MRLISTAFVCLLALYFIDAALADGAYFRAFRTVATQLMRAVNWS